MTRWRCEILRRNICLFVGLLLLLVAGAAQAQPTTVPAAGLRENPPDVHALVNVKIVVSPDRTIERGTLVIRDGLIAEVGADVAAPDDARVWDLEGKTIYPGLIDAYGEQTTSNARTGQGAEYWNSQVVPQNSVGRLYKADQAINRTLRGQGIAVRLMAPTGGLIKGTSACVSMGEDGGSRAILKDHVALHARLSPRRGESRDEYPNSPMGAMSLVRQALHDADWYRQAWDAYERQNGTPRPERNDALEALRRCLDSKCPVIIDAQDELYFLRADQVAREFGLNLIALGSGEEYRRLEAIKATGRAVIVPLDFPKPPSVKTTEAALAVSLEAMLHWDIAPENPGRLDAAGVRIALTTQGLSDKGGFLAAVRKAVQRGLKPMSALRAMTITPAELFGLSDRLGTLEKGKIANIVVTDGDLFGKKTEVLETWVDGRRHEVQRLPKSDLRGTWEVMFERPAKDAAGESQTVTIKLAGTPSKLTGKLLHGEKEIKLTGPAIVHGQFSASFKGDELGGPGIVRLSAQMDASKPEAPTWLGTVEWPDGRLSRLSAKQTAKHEPGAEEQKEGAGDKGSVASESEDEKDKTEDKDDTEKKETLPEDRKALFAVNYPLGPFGRAEPPARPQAVVFRNATVWTSGSQAVLEGASVLVESGKITAVGKDIKAPDNAVIVDCEGKHLSPGIIDCHSHIATDGGVNESGQTITAEVRIGDFIDPNDIAIYRQLAGGVTSSNILHGSANTIGGQNQVIKMRWGALPEEMKFEGAPPGVKFALGENVKQSNWGDRYNTRYPQTRMGVEQLVRDAFRAARDYRQQWSSWRQSHKGLPPRVDLELEALAEVVEGTRLIHCHSYRQDEILALMRTCEEFGIKIATLQHILEGYKVADVMARQGIGGSSFSDWWAYKFEVYDAIPYNGALMHNAGVVVSFNSDDAELARRLNLEAAKAVKYGGIPPAEALQFVTLNPAKQLRIDGRVGSIEAGKDADLVVWNASPLSTYSVCEQTWIDGRKYFDRDEDRKHRAEVQRMRAALVQRILASGEAMVEPGESTGRQRELWPREDIFCGRHRHYIYGGE
jgi:imidazolonepropionase-like amidohydrolase